VTNNAVRHLAHLRRDYQRYLRKPDEPKWLKCEHRHALAVAALSAQPFTHTIDHLVAGQIKAGNATPTAALNLLTVNGRPKVKFLEFERNEGRRLGYDDREIAEIHKAALKALKRAATVGTGSMAPSNSQGLLLALLELHRRVHNTVADTTHERRKRKSAHREDAFDYVALQIYMLGVIVLNASGPGMFDVSYALSIGTSLTAPRKRRHLQMPTSLRSCDVRPGDERGEAAA
jgi:hypothetical protein